MVLLRFALVSIVFVITSTFPALSQTKPTIELPIDGSLLTPGQQLQDAVANPANKNVVLRLARGTYLLDPTRPAGGRLILQQGMEIVGSNAYVDCDGNGVWDPILTCLDGSAHPEDFTVEDTETLIDGSLVITQESIPGTTQSAPTGLVRVGRNNRISRVTIRGANSNNVVANVHVNLQSEDGLIHAIITDNILENGSRGIVCNNPQGHIDGTSSSATVKGNIVRNNFNGIQIQNANWDGNSWDVVIKHNRIYGHRQGIFVIGNQTAFANTNVTSGNNLIESNRLGIMVMAGQDSGGMRGDFGLEDRGATNNLFSFVSKNDVIRNNTGNLGIANLGGNRLGGGVVAIAGANVITNVAPTSGNNLVIQFIDTLFQDNLWKPDATHPGYTSHISTFGYWTFQNREIGTYNTARIRVRLAKGDQTDIGFWKANSIPHEPAGTNKAIVFSSNVEFRETDPQGFPTE